MLVVRQLIHGVPFEVLALTLQEPVIVGLVDILYILFRLMRLSPGGSPTATRFLSNGECNALIEGTTAQSLTVAVRQSDDSTPKPIRYRHHY